MIFTKGALPRRPRAQVRAARVPEIDAIRGTALFLMLLQHLAFDLYYGCGWRFLSFTESRFFLDLLRPCVLVFFLICSGLSSRFSRSFLRHGLRIAAAAALLSAVTVAVDHRLLFFDGELQGISIYFNVLHVLAAAVLLDGSLRALFSVPLSRGGSRALFFSAAELFLSMLVTAILFTWNEPAPYSPGRLIIGLKTETLPAMGDYLPLFPWILFFFFGRLCGDVFYAEARSYMSERAKSFPGVSFVSFLGRHPLAVYLLHQPLLMLLLFPFRR